jgi:hypothetical protein
MTLHRRICNLEALHAFALNRCGTCGGPDPDNPRIAITRQDRPLRECPECGLHLDDEGQPLPRAYKRIILPDGGVAPR